MSDLRGKSVWITGASAGIGSALAHSIAARGARVLLSARRVDRLNELARTIPGAEVLSLDQHDLDSLPGKVDEALARMGSIDVMVHNAGVGQRSLAVDTSFEVDRYLMQTNYLGPVALTKLLLPHMRARGNGTFVVVSSVLGMFGAPRRSGYAASKHALHGYFDSFRAEVAPLGIRVLLVCPGRVRSEFSEAALEGDGSRHGTMDATSYKGIAPEAVAERTVRALLSKDEEVVVARWERVPVLLRRVSPALFRRALARSKLT